MFEGVSEKSEVGGRCPPNLKRRLIRRPGERDRVAFGDPELLPEPVPDGLNALADDVPVLQYVASAPPRLRLRQDSVPLSKLL